MILSAIIWICTSTNIQGDTFQAYDPSEDVAAQRAIALCQMKNQRCFPMECRQEPKAPYGSKCQIEIPQPHLSAGSQCYPGEVMTGYETLGGTNYLMCSSPRVVCQ